MIRRTITILFFVISIFFSCGRPQNLTDRFQNDIKAYTEAYDHGDWGKVTDMTYPKIFDTMPKQQMIFYFMLLEGTGITAKLEFKEVEKISDVIINGNEKFCRVYYHGLIKNKICGEPLPETIDMLKHQMEQLHGKGNVRYDESQKQIIIDAHQSMIAVADKNSGDWKYIEYSKEKRASLRKLIPEEVWLKLE